MSFLLYILLEYWYHRSADFFLFKPQLALIFRLFLFLLIYCINFDVIYKKSTVSLLLFSVFSF